MIEIPEATQVLPRLWIGTPASCDNAPAGIFCLCVLEEPHALRCQHVRILGEDGKAEPELLDKVNTIIEDHWHYRDLLIHCGAGAERSPLAVAWWMRGHFGFTLDEAYAWLKLQRPQVEDRRSWIRE